MRVEKFQPTISNQTSAPESVVDWVDATFVSASSSVATQAIIRNLVAFPVTSHSNDLTPPYSAYRALNGAVEALSKLGMEDSQGIDAETASMARNLLGLFSLYDVPIPQLFSNGHDSVVFKWQSGSNRRYATICDYAASIREISDIGATPPPTQFEMKKPDEFSAFIRMLGGSPWRKSNSV